MTSKAASKKVACKKNPKLSFPLLKMKKKQWKKKDERERYENREKGEIRALPFSRQRLRVKSRYLVWRKAKERERERGHSQSSVSNCVEIERERENGEIKRGGSKKAIFFSIGEDDREKRVSRWSCAEKAYCPEILAKTIFFSSWEIPERWKHHCLSLSCQFEQDPSPVLYRFFSLFPLFRCFPARPIFHFRLFFSLLVGSRRISYQRSQPQTGEKRVSFSCFCLFDCFWDNPNPIPLCSSFSLEIYMVLMTPFGVFIISS